MSHEQNGSAVSLLQEIDNFLCACVDNKTTIVTAQAKPKPQLSQIRLGLELGNASVSTHTLYKLFQTNFPLYGISIMLPWKLIIGHIFRI